MKTSVLSLFILCSYALTVNARANAECTKKDLTDPDYLRSVGKENLIQHFSKPRNQDSVGWCGAYATTDSLSFALGEVISAVDISLNHYANTNETGPLHNLSGISILSATEVSKINGYCPESIIPSDQTSSSNLGHQAILILMSTFQKIAEDFISKGKPKDYCVQCSGDQFEKIIKPTLPQVTGEMIREVLVQNEGDSLKSIQALLKKLCEGKRKKATPETELIVINKQNVSKILDDALENDSMPSIGMNTTNFATNEAVPGGHGLHEMMIVARRPGPDGKCEYQIRNSWGRSCSFYQPELKAKCDAEKGTFWMSSDQLQTSVADVLIIKSPKKAEEKLAEKPVEKVSENPVPKNTEKEKPAKSKDRLEYLEPVKKSNQKQTDNYVQPVEQFDFVGMMKKIWDGISYQVGSIWQMLSNMFKY